MKKPQEKNVFARRLRDLRIDHGMTQTDIAKEIGLSPVTVNRYEAGDRLPPHETLNKLANLFHTNVDYLLGRTDKKTAIVDKEMPLNLEDLFKEYNIYLFNEPIDDESKRDIYAFIKWKRQEKKADIMRKELKRLEEGPEDI